jgi:type IV fimbrial biogenesis protein FimT
MNSRLKASGVTLIELIVVMTIAAILIAIAVPSYKYVTTSNRIAGEINDLLGDISYARYEAIKEGLNVTICPAATPTSSTCDSGTNWAEGWIVQSNSGAVLRRRLSFLSFNSLDTLTGSTGLSSLVFNREGFVTPNAAVMFSLHDPKINPGFTRCLVVSAAGALATTSSGNSVWSETC